MDNVQKWEWEILEELPNKIGSIYYFPNGSNIGGQDGLIVKVEHNLSNKSWVGIFAFGELTTRGITGVYSELGFDRMYVVSRGMGYWVTFDNPLNWDIIECHPIIECMPIASKETIVFGEFTKLVAYGKDGIKWKTKRLSFDNLTLTNRIDNFLIGEYYDIRTEATETFKVNLLNGEHNGSAGTILP